LHFGAPDHDRDGQRQDHPELAPERVRVVPGVVAMTTVRAVISVHLVPGVVAMTTVRSVIGVHLVPDGGCGRGQVVVVMLLGVVHWGSPDDGGSDTPHQYAPLPHAGRSALGCR